MLTPEFYLVWALIANYLLALIAILYNAWFDKNFRYEGEYAEDIDKTRNDSLMFILPFYAIFRYIPMFPRVFRFTESKGLKETMLYRLSTLEGVEEKNKNIVAKMIQPLAIFIICFGSVAIVVLYFSPYIVAFFIAYLRYKYL